MVTKADLKTFSREVLVIGEDGLQRLLKSSVLVAGMGGVGAEIAKDLILSGVGSITIQDTEDCTRFDLSSQFCLSSTSVGKNRAVESVRFLSSLQNDVVIRTYTMPLTEDYVKHFEVVVLTASNNEELSALSEATHSKGIPLIIANSHGVCGRIFCDFGVQYKVTDTNSEPPAEILIAGITREKEGTVVCMEDTRHNLSTGDFVTFYGIEGMTELNGCEPRRVNVLTSDAFSIGDTSAFSNYIQGGIAKQVKMPRILRFLSYNDSLLNPEILYSDLTKTERSLQMHIAFCTMNDFIRDRGKTPTGWSYSEAADFVYMCSKTNNRLNGLVDVLDEDMLSLFAKSSSGTLAPVTGLIGNLAAQEVIKALTKKQIPIKQWFYFDAIECLTAVYESESSIELKQSRYDGQIAILGNEAQRQLEALEVLVVGAGAVGCELLKNFAMMGVGINTGRISIADMDVVERSNLNTQLLYREKNLGQPKAIVAATSLRYLNHRLNLHPIMKRVDPDSENMLHDEFYEKLHAVFAAVDNLDSRTYLDRMCVYHKIPLLEGGTLATKAHSQVVIPNLTESYNSASDPIENVTPTCTLKTFPNTASHAIEWARDLFQLHFVESMKYAEMYVKQPELFKATLKSPGSRPVEMLQSVKSALESNRPNNFQDCIIWARHLWQDLFHNQIQQLIHCFPRKSVGPSGTPFWSGPKKCPTPIKFNIEDSDTIAFIVTAARLKAKNYGIITIDDRSKIAAYTSRIKVDRFVPKDGAILKDGSLTAVSSVKSLVELRIRLPNPTSFSEFQVRKLQMNLDVNNNFQLEFLVAAANLRARNYNISPPDPFQVKIIAANIVPSLITTAGAVANLLTIELIKVAQGLDLIDLYKNTWMNLAIGFFTQSEPGTPKVQRFGTYDWTLWDRFEIHGEITLMEFLKHFRTVYKLSVNVITQGNFVIYSKYRSYRGRHGKTISQLVTEISQKPISPLIHSILLELTCTNYRNEEVEVPFVKYILPAVPTMI